MMPRPILWLPATLVLAAPVHLQGQANLNVSPGDRVRVTTRTIGTERLVGTLTALDTIGRTLEIQRRAARLTLLFDSVATLEVRRPPSASAMVASACIGAGLAALIGAGIGAAAGTESCAPQALTCADKGDLALTGAVVFALIGAALGYRLTNDRSWKPVPLDGLRLSMSRNGQAGIAISALRHF